MTYLELVNAVLTRMREDSVDTVQSIDDEVVRIVADLVNDAKRKVENSWRWNNLRYEWELGLVVDQQQYVLSPSDNFVQIDHVWHTEKAYDLKESSNRFIKRKGTTGSAANPIYYSINGTTAAREVKVDIWPRPKFEETLEVIGWKPQVDLSADADIMLVPHLPVVYEALAMALRERGEVGGQTSMEIFGMAKNYLGDAIAQDAGMGGNESDWYAV